MMSNWDHWITNESQHVRSRCLKGIPPALRPRTWKYLARYSTLTSRTRSADLYSTLVASEALESTETIINIDVPRTFPGQEQLLNHQQAFE